MSRKYNYEYRIAIGNEKGRRSTVWKVWVHKTNIYIQSRMMGSDLKVSLHEGGQGQFSMTSEWLLKQNGNIQNPNRHIEKWKMPIPRGNNAVCIFKIVIPESELREINISERLQDVNWINAPSIDSAIEIDLHLTAPNSKTPPTSCVPHHHLFTFPLENGEWLVGVYQEEVINEENNAEMRRLRIGAQNRYHQIGIKPELGHRTAGLFSNPNGYRGLIEIVLHEDQ